MTIRITTEQNTLIRSICAIIIPTQSTAKFFNRPTWNCTHSLHTLRTQDATTIPFTTILQGSTKNCDIFSTGEYTGIATDTTIHDTCQWIMHLSQKYLTIDLLFSRSNNVMPITFHQFRPMSIGSINPIALLVAYCRQIVGIIHTQYVKQVFTGKLTECLSAHLLDDILQSNEVQTTISPIGLRFVYTLASRNVFHQTFRIRRTILFFQLSRRAV